MAAPLAPYALFAAVLAAAGLPIYIHAPKFFVDEYGVGLTGMAAVLFGLRLLDVVQDPALGWLSRRLGALRGPAVAIASGLMALAMLGLFAVTPPVAPLLWFALTLTLLFSAFSFLTISFYAQGVARARTLDGNGHVRLAGWRETGALVGISLASVAPVALALVTDNPFAAFAALFAVLALAAVFAMRSEWTHSPRIAGTGIRPYLSHPVTRRLLMIALLNAMPVAVTSTLFLFFVEHRLAAPGWEGPLLLLFFIAAAAAAPVWARTALRFGERPTLLFGMALAIASFTGAAFLGPGDILPFAIICLASGAALGADMTLLPAIFARESAEIAAETAEGFGLWSFVSKFSLAFAAVLFLPLLEASGFAPGRNAVTEDGLAMLTIFYAIVPLGLKLAAFALLAATTLGPSPGGANLRGAPS